MKATNLFLHLVFQLYFLGGILANMSEDRSILVRGRNCWRIESAERVSFLIDGASYFAAFMSAVERASKSILIVGWDFDSRVQLLHDREAKDRLVELGEFLNAIVSERKGLHAYILDWDFAMIYALEREFLPVFRFDWQTHERLHFRWDGNHPVGASHHQKIVVVDDAIAFVGGIDLTKNRWDTQEHLADDPRRVDPSGRSYPPFHDVQMAVDGEAAAALGELARQRWHRATGQRLQSPAGQHDPWPPELGSAMEKVRVGIARTQAAHNGAEEIREVENLYCDAIATARQHIYIENQYFTSRKIYHALAARLQEEDGPEIVLILPHRCSGWLEESTMGELRARFLTQLQEQDTKGKLRVYYPTVKNQHIMVHAKLMVIDNRMVRVGSANLSNRSMALDTECDLAIESRGEDPVEHAIAAFRNRLLGEHLGVSSDQVNVAHQTEGSLAAAVQKLGGRDRTLVPLSFELAEDSKKLLSAEALADPEQPMDSEEFLKKFIPEDVSKPAGHRLRNIAILLVVMLLVSAAWRWTPLGDWLNLERISGLVSYLRAAPAAPFIVIGIFIVGGLILIPVTLLIVATAFAFGPLAGFSYSLLGCLASAALAYMLGRMLGRDTVRRMAGSRLNRVSRRLADHGVLTVLAVRLLPVAPFTLINLIAGASHIRLRDFVIGTVLGIAPGIFAITLFEHQLEKAIHEPSLAHGAIVAALLAIMVIAYLLLKHRLGNSRQGR
jgi:phosphatidylserine/phosphatidylglycerophosphate/cardiolipin synthase-like enzyme/uncharacterized membrane protein YdjX (TVP38/TMEM64 family)